MENVDGWQPRQSIVSDIAEEKKQKNAFMVRGKARFHSWPFLPLKHEGLSSNVANNVQSSWNLPGSIWASDDLPLHPLPTQEQSYISEESTELPGSPDVLPETESLIHTATSLSAKSPPPPLHRPQSLPCSLRQPECPKPAPRLGCSSPILQAHSDLGHYASSDDSRSDLTLKEALELLPNEPRQSRNQFSFESTTGRIFPSCHGTLQGKVSTGTASFDGGLTECELRSRFSRQKSCPRTILPEPHVQRDRTLNHPVKHFMAKLSRPLTWFSFKCPQRSSRPSEQEKLVEIGQPFNPRRSRVMNEGSQNLDLWEPLHQSPLHFPRVSTLDGDRRPLNVRRLSITESFGPSLGESIDDTISSSRSCSVRPLSSSADTRQRFPDALIPPFANRPTSQTVRFYEPERRRCPPSLRIQIPPSPPCLFSADAYHPSRSTPSPPPRRSSASPAQLPETHLSIRGGCLPISRTRHPPAPPRRIDPSRRPADNVRIPSGLWYLAGGRRVLSDTPGQPCYHGQPEPKRRFKQRRGLRELHTSRLRVPNAEPCEPLTFGHLRNWKQQSRPADRLDPHTGQMEPVYRRFWQEFAYSATRGKVRSMRPRREKGTGGDYYGHSQGMAGEAEEPVYT